SIPGEILYVLGVLSLMGGGALLVLGSILLFRGKQKGALLTVLGGAAAVVAFIFNWTGSIVSLVQIYPEQVSFYKIVDGIKMIFVFTALAGIAPLALGLLPPLKRSLR
ncbi:hypothetical protein ABTZ89_12320, partial [Saccharopolyspora sp. NPDC002686]